MKLSSILFWLGVWAWIFLACVENCRAQTMLFSWTPATTNQTGYIVCEGRHTGEYCSFYHTDWTNFYASTAMFPQGISHWTVMQDGSASVSDNERLPLGGEILVSNSQVAVVGSVIWTSTDIGGTWAIAGTNSVVFPTAAERQRFFRASAMIQNSNILQQISP